MNKDSFRKAVARLLPRHGLAFRVARKIVNLHEGDNDCDMHTNGELRLARAVLPHCRVVFDVGANVGEWTELALSINGAARYYSFEPSAPTFRSLASHAFPPNVRLEPFGLGSAAEERTLFVFAETMGSNSLYDRVGTEAEPQSEEVVKLRTLDDYCTERSIEEVDFVKIDVEGHELAVLRGATRMLSEGRLGVIQFEYGGAYIDARTLLKDIWNLVLGLNSGYTFFKIFPDGPHPVAKYMQTLEKFQYSNWVIARPDWVERLHGQSTT